MDLFQRPIPGVAWGVRVAIFVSFAGTIFAQGFATPSLGFFFDLRSGEIRSLFGIPGSASIGPSIQLDRKLSSALVCSSRSFALGVGRIDGNVELVSLAEAAVNNATPLNVPRRPSRLFFSPDCSSAALIYDSTAQAVVLSGLPERPSTRIVDLSVLPTAAIAVAIDDPGTALLVSTSAEGKGVVERFSNDVSGPQLILSTAGISAMTFLRNSPDAVIADPISNQLFLLRDAAAGQSASSLVASKTEGVGDAASLAVSGDNRYVIVANSASASVAMIDLEKQSGQELPCSCQMKLVSALKSDSIFAFTDKVGHPIALLETAGLAPRLTLVPVKP